MNNFDYFDPDNWDNLRITVIPEPPPDPEPEPEPEIEEEEPEPEPEPEEEYDWPKTEREKLREKMLNRLPARCADIIEYLLDDVEYEYDRRWRGVPGHPKYEVAHDGSIRKKNRGILKIKSNGSVYIDGTNVYVRTAVEGAWPEIYSGGNRWIQPEREEEE